MKIVIDMLASDGPPKRGDLLQTNVGDHRERTCFILRAHHVKARRWHLWAERWWELEADFRMRLFRSAQRRGGQQVIVFQPQR